MRQVRSLIQLYVDMEHTGRNTAFYEKFSTRHAIGQILSMLSWPCPRAWALDQKDVHHAAPLCFPLSISASVSKLHCCAKTCVPLVPEHQILPQSCPQSTSAAAVELLHSRGASRGHNRLKLVHHHGAGYLWNIPQHQEAWRALAQEQGGRGLYMRFCHHLETDSIHLLDEAMKLLPEARLTCCTCCHWCSLCLISPGLPYSHTSGRVGAAAGMTACSACSIGSFLLWVPGSCIGQVPCLPHCIAHACL